MKSLRFVTAVSLVLLVSELPTQAQQITGRAAVSAPKRESGKPSFSIQVSTEAGAFILKIDNPSGKKLDLSIRHTLLTAGLDTTISSASYACRYRLDHADDGKYQITVVSGRERITREIEVSTVVTTNRQVTVL